MIVVFKGGERTVTRPNTNMHPDTGEVPSVVAFQKGFGADLRHTWGLSFFKNIFEGISKS